MVHDIGLLSKGNEEMVHSAWNTFSDYQRTGSETEAEEEKKKYRGQFKETFYRPDVDAYFFSLFDCVNSVGQFEIPLFRISSPWVPIPPAKYTRHAVSIRERRLKYKPKVFKLDDSDSSKNLGIKEVWFVGNHADIGGGWDRVENKRLLSDIPLEWMIEEISSLEDGASHLAIDKDRRSDILNSSGHNAPHDMLARGSGNFYARRSEMVDTGFVSSRKSHPATFL